MDQVPQTDVLEVVDLGEAKELTKGWQDLPAPEANPVRPTRQAI
jgi:hypothetical protein